jgi:hypothetical protein
VNEDRRQTPIAGRPVCENERNRYSVESQVYRIRVKGHLDNGWSEWFEGLSVTREGNGTTVLTGPVADQPALHGLLAKIRDLGLPLLSVNCIEPSEGEVRGHCPELDDVWTKTRKEEHK